jgi:hypothetical protein
MAKLLRPMSGLLAMALLIAGALMELMAVGMWNGREVEFIALIVLGGLVGTVFFVWQPDWADPPRQRRNH